VEQERIISPKAATIQWTRRLATMLLAAYAAALFVIVGASGSPGELIWWMAVSLLLAWAVAPLATAAFLIRRQTDPVAATISLLLMVVGVVWGIYVYVTSMYGHAVRSTSALIFLFLPLYQWALPLLVVVIGALGAAGSRHSDE
jgi:hypothetical protein